MESWYIQLVSIASPQPQGLDKMIWNTIQSGDCGGTNAEAMARKGRRKQKYSKVHAAQNMQWCGMRTSRDLQITSIRLSMIGKRLDKGEPCERLIPSMTRCKWWQFCRGSGNPWSMWRTQTAERWTLIDECWMVLAKKVVNKQSIHSSVGQGDPVGWSLHSWWQKLMNFLWAEVYDLRVEGARPCVKKEKHCCSGEKILNLLVADEELESARAEHLGPADGIPANENEREHQQVGCWHQEHVGLKKRSYGGQQRAEGGVTVT